MAEKLLQLGDVESWAAATPQPGQSHLMVTSLLVVLVALVAALTLLRILKRRRDLMEQRRWEAQYWQKEREQCARTLHREHWHCQAPADPFVGLDPQQLGACYQLFHCDSSDSLELVREHYRELTRVYHPDSSPDRDPQVLAQLERKMDLINQAYRRILQSRREAQGGAEILQDPWNEAESL